MLTIFLFIDCSKMARIIINTKTHTKEKPYLITNGFTQHCDRPTHRLGHILDLVITRDTDTLIKKLEVDNVHFTIDHFMINCILEMPKPTNKKASYILRKCNSIDHDKFSNNLKSKMHVIENSKYDNVSDLLDDYNQACCEVLDIHAPASNRSKRVNHRPCWYGKSIDDARRERRRCERRWRKSTIRNILLQRKHFR